MSKIINKAGAGVVGPFFWLLPHSALSVDQANPDRADLNSFWGLVGICAQSKGRAPNPKLRAIQEALCLELSDPDVMKTGQSQTVWSRVRDPTSGSSYHPSVFWTPCIDVQGFQFGSVLFYYYKQYSYMFYFRPTIFSHYLQLNLSRWSYKLYSAVQHNWRRGRYKAQ